jgi:hypothetical protein
MMARARRYVSLLIGLAALVGLPPFFTPAAAVTPAPARIGQVAWIAGAWAGGRAPLSLEEHWTLPAGGVMLAVSRTMKGERLVAFEFLRIVERDGTLIYVAQPGGRPPTEFVLTAIDETGATFENPAHDFPQRIRYARRGTDGLDATISAGDGGKAQTFAFSRGPR